MILTNDFDSFMQKRKPILAYNPPGILTVDLLKAVIQEGGVGLVNLERLTLDECKRLLKICSTELQDNWGIRILNKQQLALILSLPKDTSPILLILSNLDLTKTELEKIKTKQFIILAEVINLQEAYSKKWASGYIIKGYESGGRIGDETSFILTQQFADAGLSFFVHGGVGLYTSPAIFTAGAKGVILDTQLYLTPECSLPQITKDFLSKLDSTDTRVLGDSTNYKYRVYARLGTKIVNDFILKEKELLTLDKKERTEKIQNEIFSQRDMLESNNLSNSLIPIGQDISFAKILTDKFGTVAGIINGILHQVEKQLKTAITSYPLKENNPIAKELGIRYPIIQGPMANVSESPAFAKLISDAGGLPFLALGSLFKGQTRTLITKTKEKLGDAPFGCGIIGLEANKKARDEHLKIIKELKPPFVVVAAGTIDQAKEVMSYGIKTFLHTPSQAIFREAFEAGVNNFVLEGMECGGHIGVLTSFVLWELSLHELGGNKDKINESIGRINVAFAGGIGDKISAAMAGILCSAYPEIMNGLLWVGTAYILVKEIVETDTIQPLYQQLALNAKETVVVGETVNTRARSIPTPFTKVIIERELERLRQGISLAERKHQYERDNLGATRIAALGEIWNPEGEDDKPNRFMPIDEKGQYQKGNYLIGQIIASLRCIRTIDDLHIDLISNSEELVKKRIESISERIAFSQQQIEGIRKNKNLVDSEIDQEIFDNEGVAIVGLGCVFPDALNINAYWNNILNKVYSIREIPPERWADNIDIFYNQNKEAPNKTYTKIAAAISNFNFNSLDFKIPPKVALTMGRAQKFALVAAKEALEDAKMLGNDYDHSRTAVIIGNSMGDEIRTSHSRKVFAPEVLSRVEKASSFSNFDKRIWEKIKTEVIEDYETRLVPINEDTMPGELSNVIAGRVANTFNLRGKNMTTDAACASSLAALNVAVKGLLDFEYDIVLCGGADCSLDPPTFIKFSKIGALSAEGSFPFDERANGFVMGEGSGFCILKRLSDAIRNNDKIYAVIRGMGASSDGKGKGITAPNPSGQKLAIERALEQAKTQITDLQYIEAHGTSTSVGDAVELQILNEIATNIAPGSIAIGSVKSQIGHLKSAAGIASLIKTALALYHKTLPPSINFEKPNPKVNWKISPFYVNTTKKDWVKPTTEVRLAGVSSFGFGGTNFHAILEEYNPGVTKGYLPKVISREEIQKFLKLQTGSLSHDNSSFQEIFDQKGWQDYYQEKACLETEALFIGVNSSDELLNVLQKYQANIITTSYPIDGIGTRVRDLAFESSFALSNKYKLGITVNSVDDIPSIVNTAIEGLNDKAKRIFLQNKGIFYSEDHSLGKVAFLFPGQGSQYVRMGKELWDKYDIVRETFKEADEITEKMMKFKITDAIFAIGKNDEEANELLKQTEITQPAIFVLNIAIYRLLESFGIKPDFVAGHSLGEYAALVAAGILSFSDGLRAVVPRGQAMAEFSTKDKGIMASVNAGYEEIDVILQKIDGYVICANKNTPNQTVISGATKAVKAAMKIFAEKGIQAVEIPVSAAFHSKIVQPAVDHLKISLEKLTFNKPKIKISSNVSGELYPTTRDEIINLLCEQISSPVEWIKQIKSMYDKYGVKTFIEIGPKYVLTSFTRAILENKKDYFALASNHPKKGAMQHFNEVIAALGAFGYPLKIPSLNDSIYSNEFKNPLKKFFVKKPTEKQTAISTIIKESPFDVLLDQELEEISNDSSFRDYLELQGPAIAAFLKVGYNTYKDKIAIAMKEKEEIEKLELNTEPIAVTGISIGLPGKNRHVFDDSNFDAILSGQNFIEKIPLEFRNKMVDKNIVRLVKDAVKGAQFQTISDVKDVIKLAAQKGEFDLTKEYGIDVEFTSILDITFQLAFAAGIEALRDAGIPLVPLKVQTSVGKEITKGWALPESLRDDTGIVFASAFPGYSNLISTISRYLTDKYSRKNNEEITNLYQEMLDQISNETAKKQITTWFEKNRNQISTEETQFEFNRKFLFEILSMGHSQFAQLICARGPNTQVNAACSSTTQAIAIGEDWIHTGRCNRVIIIAADDVTNDEMLEWITSGFLAIGAATTEEKVEKAALPFDNRRHGMIIGMGAAGIILESDSAIKIRGVKPIADLLGTHIVNSAYHGTRLDRDHISSQMDEFITKIEKRYQISREQIAQQMVFVSHETYTPARGGSASAEIDALRKTFGNYIDNIVIANTKGFTGHAMGAGIEDVVAIKMLEKGIVPPVANWKEQDPELGKLNLSKGGNYDIKYALRFAAGFGSQLTLALFRLNTRQDRFQSNDYDLWLQSLQGSRQTLEVVNKTLRLNEDPSLIHQKQIESKSKAPIIQTSSTMLLDKDLLTSIVNLISEKTGYPADMIEPNMHLEEDLGIDTVKQAELFGLIRTKYNLPREEGVRIQEYSSVNKIAEYISSKLSPGTVIQKEAVQYSSIIKDEVSSQGNQKSDIVKEIINLISDKTGYPVEMIESEMELEEDLGIDTVKQAEMFGIIRTKWNLPREEGIKIQEYSTVNKIADYILNRLKGTETKQSVITTSGTSKEATMDEIVPVRRLTLKLVEAPLPKVEKHSLTGKKFIIIGDNDQFANELQEIIQKQKGIIIKVLDIKRINSEIKLEQEVPSEELDGLIYIEPKVTQKNKHSITTRTLFLLCKLIKFSKNPFILTINNSDSAFGWDGKVSPIVGSITGFTKSIAREFSSGTVRTVSCLKPEQAINELISGDGSIEIAYDKTGTRRIFVSQELPISTEQLLYKPTSEDLIVISGGAQGITYEISKKIAETYKAKLALLGRTKLPDDIDKLIALDQNGLDNLKAQIINQLKTKEEKVTPVMIDKEWSKITKAISVKKALNYLIEKGSETRYYSVDVVNNIEMVQTINNITKDFKQSITGVIHGAGLESSKLISEKKLEDFDNVYNVKAIGFDNLINNVDNKQLKFVVCFSSVAGRFGNAGQVDYSAANDYLSKSCWCLNSQGLRAIAICWSAWDEIGMATRGSVMKILKYAGVTPVTIKEGVTAFIQELEFGREAEVVIAGNLGVLLDSPSAYISIDPKTYPLIGQFKRNFDGSIIAERIFSLENDLYLNHHRFEEIPYLPGVMGLELFTELAKIMYPSKVVRKFENVSFKSAVKFKNDTPKKLKSRLTFGTDSATAILESDFEKDGIKLGETRTHFSADIIFGIKERKIMIIPKIKSGYLVNNSKIYQILPHKELFQTLEGIKDISKQIISIPTEVKDNQFAWAIKRLYAEPLLIEAAFQTMGLLDIIRDSKLGLPFGIKSLQYYQTNELPAYVIGTKITDTDLGSLYDFEIITKAGELIMDARGYATVHVNFGADLSALQDIQIERIRQLFSLPAGSYLEVSNVEHIKKMIETNPDFIINYLHPEEIEHMKTLTIEKRRYEWLSGIIAIKKALQKYKPDMLLNKIKIEKNNLGKPFIEVNKNENVFISITHSNGFAVGIINPEVDTGIDLEIIEGRDSAIIDEVLSSKDKEFLSINKQAITEELLTKIWTAKEAASKVLGVGLNIDLHDLIVSKYNDQEIIIHIDSSKLPQFNRLRSSDKNIELLSKLNADEDFVAAVCQLKQK